MRDNQNDERDITELKTTLYEMKENETKISYSDLCRLLDHFEEEELR